MGLYQSTSSSFSVCFLLMAIVQVCVSLPPSSRTIEIPFFEEQVKGTKVHDLKKNLAEVPSDETFYKLVSQSMMSGDDIIDDVTHWVALNERTGVITVETPVDRETDCGKDSSQACVIHVTVVRRPQLYFEMINLELEVVDINDHSPVFPIQPVISVNVSEASPVNTRISLDRFLATDDDIYRNSMIYYTLSRNDYFNLHGFKDATDGTPRLELVVTDELDHEQEKFYDLILTATDRGNPIPRSSQVTLRVGILDANDNSPVFDKQVYQLQLKENLEAGTVITTVHAKDTDELGEIRYFIPTLVNTQVAQELIVVDPLAGNVILKETLDREKHNNIRIVIGARDSETEESRTGKTIVEIKVEDENDNSPTIKINVVVESNHSTAYLSEYAKIGTYVAQITADDADDGINGEVTVEISTSLLPSPSMQPKDQEHSEPDFPKFVETEDINQYFVLEGKLIATGQLLDREKYPGFIVMISACDKGEHSLCSSKNLTVQIMDENEYAPSFFNTVETVQLREDTELGTLITTVTAADRDSLYQSGFKLTKDSKIEESRNGVVRYMLLDGDGCFVVDEVSGKIRLVGALDYEKQKNWQLTVVARDEGEPSLSANFTLFVDVIDVNDNKPVFSNPAINNSTVAATIQSGGVITRIKAIDYDENAKSEVWYSVTTEDEGTEPPRKFLLDQFKGDLRLNISNQDLKGMVGTHTIMIKAQDMGNPPLESFTTLRIEVYDVPLSMLPVPTTWSQEKEEMGAGGLSYTVILIVSLASATVLLILVLTAVIVKCKKENKEIRTYNCRSAESKQGWQLDISHPVLEGSEAMETPSNHLLESRESKTNNSDYNKNSAETRFTQNPKFVIKSHTDSMSNVSQRFSDRKMTSFTKPKGIVDGDSGRGDSDHESGSYEDKAESVPHDQIRLAEDPHYHFSQAAVDTEAIHDNNMGPLCTHLCRQYGHSDACWMHVLDEQDQVYHYIPHVDAQEPITSTGVYHPYPLHHVGLETICETQPLHSVLATGEYSESRDVYYKESFSPPGFPLNEREEHFYPVVHAVSRPSSWLQSPSPLTSNEMMSVMPSCHQKMNVPGAYEADGQHSVSDMFHDVMGTSSNPASPCSFYHSSISSPDISSTYGGSHASNSRGGSPSVAAANNKRTAASLHGELLHRRFLAAAQGITRANASPVTSQFGEVTMEETQQIIHDIDQLIDH